jgi:type II restriction enzyme
MHTITATEIVNSINQLPKTRSYNYIDAKNKSKIQIVDVQFPEGPIIIKRCNPSKRENFDNAESVSISAQMIWRVANSIEAGHPINFDRVLGASYNTRSVLEALMANTPEFYTCNPGRIESIRSSTQVKKGHKHLIWRPDLPHEIGIVQSIDTDIVISEIRPVEIMYDPLQIPTADLPPGTSIEVARRHVQMQICLIKIGIHLGFRIWVAQNDRTIQYNNSKLCEWEGVIKTLKDEKLLVAYNDAIKAALFIDCIWFRNSKFMPAVIEIEHSTGVTSGLSRMKNFQDLIPHYRDTRWVIAAPDEDRVKVTQEANKSQFKTLDTKFFPYSSIEELYSLCERRKVSGVNDQFLDCFMESCVR